MERTWRKGNLSELLVGMEIDAATMETSTEVPQEIKNRPTARPKDPTSGYIFKGNKTKILGTYKHSQFICNELFTLFTIAKTWKQPKFTSTE